MVHRTVEEAKNVSIAKMGEDLGSFYSELWQETAYLESKWQQFVELYGTRPERIDLLNDTAPYFFHLLQSILWEDIVLHIARMIDEPASLGRQDRSNLSLQGLPPLIADDMCRKEVVEKIDVAIDATKFARDWRNRHIAHRDLSLALDDHAKPLEVASRNSVRMALKAIEDVLNVVEAHYHDSETYYGAAGGPGDAMSLLHVLHDGRKVAREREARLERGEFTEEDLPPEL